ncbi:hypothetical protein SETIT_3G275900v2 [Setaria italica]|uniref:Uncharacterized protein n=1 Tax=Setaria italica TaxID=4555 RepID=A0A368QJS1_SETIT|nr:hypothetical protein SETIT_3G275900v2 [Setaria italica]
MEEEEGAREVYQTGTSFVVPSEARTRVPPPPGLSPSIVNICKAYSGLPHDMEMFDDEDEDADYELDDDKEEEDVEDEAEEEAVTEGLQMVDIDMGSFSEPGREKNSSLLLLQ